MSEREICTNRICAHDKLSHFARTTLRPASSPDERVTTVTVYGVCLAHGCGCQRYERNRAPR